jgi:hypothetical protein
MRRLAERLGLTFSDKLLVPTFNGRPIRADSSGPVHEHGVIRERAERPPLDPETETAIARGTDELYAKAMTFVLRP